MTNLDPLLADGVIDEVLGRLKSGKEADIWLVRRAGVVVAAKLYKDRDRRSFKNNADYKEGRDVRNSRTRRAIESGSSFGREAEEQAWKSAEADALNELHAAGVRVPRPILFYEGVLLMDVVLGADGEPALRYMDVPGLRPHAQALYRDLRSQIVRMLCCDIIHGDLSAYNILAGAAGPTIIDFPQIIAAAANSRAEFFFLRDFQNVLQFLAAEDRSLLAFQDDGRKIWHAYGRRTLTPDFQPSPPGTGDDRSRPSHDRRPHSQLQHDRRPPPQPPLRPQTQRPPPPRENPRPQGEARGPQPPPPGGRPPQPAHPQNPGAQNPGAPRPDGAPGKRRRRRGRGRGPGGPPSPQSNASGNPGQPGNVPRPPGNNGPRPPNNNAPRPQGNAKPNPLANPRPPKLPGWLKRAASRGGGGGSGPPSAHPDDKKPFRRKKRRF